jgi:hypothetical protein
MTMTICNTWLIHGDLNKVAEFSNELPEADGIGFVYVLSLSNNTRKLGCTANLYQRLRTNGTEMSRYGVSVQFCSVTRPHFNFRTVEQNALHWLNSVGTKEILSDPHKTVCEAVAAQHLDLLAPDSYVVEHQTAYAYVAGLMRDIGGRLGIASQPEITRGVSRILDAHTKLGRLTGLSETDSMLNALAVIESQTGLKLQSLRDVLLGVA